MDTKATASEPFTGGTVIPPNPYIYININRLQLTIIASIYGYIYHISNKPPYIYIHMILFIALFIVLCIVFYSIVLLYIHYHYIIIIINDA